MSTLYISDLDGTLLNNGSFISPRSSEIISDLSHDGALITVATARTPATVVPLMEGTFTRLPYIVLTGAALYDHASSSYHDVVYIPPADVDTLRSLYADAGVHPFIYHLIDSRTLLVYHHRNMTTPERDFYEQRSNLTLKRFTFEPLPAPIASANVILLFSMGPRSVIQPLADAIATLDSFSVSCYPDIFSHDTMLLEVFHNGVSKATAVSRLKVSVGASRLVVFGDNLNDLPMMEVADLAVAVDNAHPRVKDFADIIIGPNYDDSVPRFISNDLA